MSDIKRYKAVLAITFLCFLAETIGSFYTKSNGLLSDALHLFGDAIPFALGYFVLFWADELPEEVEGNLEHLVVILNTLFLVGCGVSMAGAGIYRLLYPKEVDPLMFYVAFFGVAGNIGQLYFGWGLKHAHKHAGTWRSLMLHLAADVLSSTTVVVAGYAVYVGIPKADSYASIVVAIITLYAAWHCWHHTDEHEEHGGHETHSCSHGHLH